MGRGALRFVDMIDCLRAAFGKPLLALFSDPALPFQGALVAQVIEFHALLLLPGVSPELAFVPCLLFVRVLCYLGAIVTSYSMHSISPVV